jgi:hypothetical protein
MSLRIFALCTSLLAMTTPAGAQQFNNWMTQRPEYGDQYRASYADVRRIAYDNGYREGRRDGEDAARDRRSFDLQRERDYRNGDQGYNRSYGDKNLYRDSFRSGFADGYREAYNRFSYNSGGYYGGRVETRRDGGWGYPSPAPRTYPSYPSTYPDNGYGYGYGANIGFQNGLNDGYQKGLDDLRDRKYPDYARQKWYRSGDRHYDSRYGSKDLYRDQYRRGFQQGYDRAYQEGRRY